MQRSSGRTVAAFLLAAVTAAACAAERAAPVLTPPPPPSTTTVATTQPPPPTSPPPTAPSSTTAPTTTTTPPSVRPAAWRAFDEALASRLLGSGDFAFSVAVAVDGTLAHQSAFGYRVPPPLPPELTGGTRADRPANGTRRAPRPRPDGVQQQDRFRIASISKVLTATVVLQLVEEGRLELGQAVGRLLGEHVGVAVTDPGVAAVTVRQLLSHTSGLSGYHNLFFDGDADSCASAARVGLAGGLAVPARSYVYSNFGYCLLGLLIEQATGRPYETEVRERLLRPLAIDGMRMAGTFDPFPNEVQHPSVPTRNYMEALGAAGAWVATPADVVRILDSLDPSKPGWHPLSTRTLDLMRRPLRKVHYPRADHHWYGLGLIVSADGSWGHTGTLENAHAMVLSRPDGVTWSLLVSGQYPWDSDDLEQIFDEAVATAGITLP